MSPQTVGLQDGETHNVLKAMRMVLIAVSVVAFVALGLLIWLYSKTIPASISLKNDVQLKTSELNDTRENLYRLCKALATHEETAEHEFDEAVATLNECMVNFPQDEILPLYKAEAYALHFAQEKKDTKDLDFALQADLLSLKIKPNEGAYDWEGLIYCLRASFGPVSGKEDASQAAKKVFQEDFANYPSHKETVRGMRPFKEYCPNDVKKYLFP
jgi:hypothetical protein